MKNKVNGINHQAVHALEIVSRGFLDYNIVGSTTFYKNPDFNAAVNQCNNDKKCLENLSYTQKRFNYKKTLDNINICDLVDNKGVQQIWIWTWYNNYLEPIESNQSMGTKC